MTCSLQPRSVAGPPSLDCVSLLDNPDFDVQIRGPHGLMARGAGARGAGAEPPAGGVPGCRGRWQVNDCLLQFHSIVGQSVVPTALKH